MKVTVKDLLDLDHTMAAANLGQFTYPWEGLTALSKLRTPLLQGIFKKMPYLEQDRAFFAPDSW